MILIRVILLTPFLILFSCEEAEYQLNNPSDPFNMDLDPPALFIHPLEITRSVNDTFSIQIYGLGLNPMAGAHIALEFDPGCDDLDDLALCSRIENIEPGLLFTGTNTPIITIDNTEKAKPDIYLFYLPDMISDHSDGGTGPLAKIYFRTGSRTGESQIKLAEGTKIRDKNNNEVFVNIDEKGFGAFIVE